MNEVIVKMERNTILRNFNSLHPHITFATFLFEPRTGSVGLKGQVKRF